MMALGQDELDLPEVDRAEIELVSREQAQIGARVLGLFGLLFALTGLLNVAVDTATGRSLIPRELVGVALQNEAMVLTASVVLGVTARFVRSITALRALAFGFICLVVLLLTRRELASHVPTLPAISMFVYVSSASVVPFGPAWTCLLGTALAGIGVSRLPQVFSVEYIPAAGLAVVATTVASAFLARLRHGLARRTVQLRLLARDLKNSHQQLVEAQLRLVQNEKLSSLADLVAGLAHELNNPLGAVQSSAGAVEVAVDKMEQDPNSADRAKVVLRRAARTVRDGVERMGRSVRRLKTFARLDEADTAWTDVNDCLQQAATLWNGVDRVRFEIERASHKRILCGPRQLNLVFSELIRNAEAAAGGTVHIRVKTWDREDGVGVRFEDDGPGMSHEVAARVFDPGFTTRARVGTGLGLAIVHRIVEGHGGMISVRSEPGRGATFEMFLPDRPAGLTDDTDGN
jgi:signal transduction histidine kinase